MFLILFNDLYLCDLPVYFKEAELGDDFGIVGAAELLFYSEVIMMNTVTIDEVNKPAKPKFLVIIDVLIDGISGIFLPFVNQLCACGILIGIVAIL